ncbi:hypothetical protein GGI20_006363, partial [Coemansia sp. BCRC 34301]
MSIKFAWQFADRGSGPCCKSEIEHLKVISDKYASVDWLDVRVPKLVAGATAMLLDESGEPVELTTDAIYGADIIEQFGIVDDMPGSADTDGSQRDVRSQPPPRLNIYKRFDGSSVDSRLWSPRQIAFCKASIIVTQPYCLPLTLVKSADELIVVLADAMLTHNWMVDEADTLHHDISPNSIMVGRDRAQDGAISVYGQLIDLDYAINVGDERILRPERSGTLPFISLLNLEADPSQRTEHDDWESLLYILCWMATFGINEADAKRLATLHRAWNGPELAIKGWRDGISMGDIVHNKRWYLDTMDVFTDSITDYFSGSHLLGHSTYDIAEH